MSDRVYASGFGLHLVSGLYSQRRWTLPQIVGGFRHEPMGHVPPPQPILRMLCGNYSVFGVDIFVHFVN